MSHALNVTMNRLFEAPAIPYSPNWNVSNGFKEVISGEFAPKLEIGQVVKSMNSDFIHIIQGTELGNIVVTETNVPSASPMDSVICVYYGAPLAVHMEEVFGKAHLQEVLNYLFAEPENFGKKFLNFSADTRERLLKLHAARIPNYRPAPVAPLNERIGYYRYGTSEVILIKKSATEFVVSERSVIDDDELPVYSISNHETEVMAVAEFKRTVSNLLG